ncbi:unnamed protein product [Peniophora sp. CBMAI 1063]|nr:unnamed protein product [Peniophora sp. CBMAI 1063]
MNISLSAQAFDTLAGVTQQNVTDFGLAVLTRRVGIAGFTVLAWDHMLTFEDEVNLIWLYLPRIHLKDYRKIAFAALFFLNRYFIPLSFLVNIVAYFGHFWTTESCFVVFEGVMTMLGIVIADLMMLGRVEALWRSSRYYWVAVGILLTEFIAFVAINWWLLFHPYPEINDGRPLGQDVVSCTMIFDPRYDKIAPASAWLPLLYDTTVIALVIARTLPRSKRKVTFATIGTEMLREGIVYYSVVFAVTFALTLMIAFADPGIKNICAQLELCLTSVMMSRITLALKNHLIGFNETDKQARYSNPPLEWGVITRPQRIALARGRVHYVERTSSNTGGMLTVVSHPAGRPEGGKKSVTILGEDRDEDRIEMVDMLDKDVQGQGLEEFKAA